MGSNKNQGSSLSDFLPDPSDGVYKSSGGPTDYTYSDGKLVENYIYRSIRGAKDVSSDSDELMRRVKNWASYYHLGIGRSNIFKVLDLPLQSRVLELGCGCGAITRYLGERFETVHSIEGSEFRAKIARERCRGLDNVKIFNCNIRGLKFDGKYDIATMIGVLEYAPSYFTDAASKRDSCLELLAHAKSALNEDGVLAIAIENRIGLKYWSGASEDHTGKLFDSINGYPDNKKIITFSKKELSDLLTEAGFPAFAFYHCFPDYKFASTVLSDADCPGETFLHNWIDTPFISYDRTRKYLLDEGLAIRALANSGMLKEFANSFLVLAYNKRSSFKSPDWIAKKISADRKKEFRAVTTLKVNPLLHVEKVRLDGSVGTIKFSSKGISYEQRIEDSEWQKGELFSHEFNQASEDKNGLKSLLRFYYEALSDKYSTGQLDSEGYPILRGDAIDAIPRNAIRLGDELNFIDGEWGMANVPIDYVLYRGIKDMGSSTLFSGRSVRNTYKYTYGLLREFFPQYNYERHYANTKMDMIFWDSIHDVSIQDDYLSTRLINNSTFRKYMSDLYTDPKFFNITKCMHFLSML
jgi:SAM-dependent methyltransferase